MCSLNYLRAAPRAIFHGLIPETMNSLSQRIFCEISWMCYIVQVFTF